MAKQPDPEEIKRQAQEEVKRLQRQAEQERQKEMKANEDNRGKGDDGGTVRRNRPGDKQ